MRSTVPVLVAAVFLLAGCGAGSSVSESKLAAQALNDAHKAALAASSIHIAGTVAGHGSTLRIDLEIVKGKGATGSIYDGGVGYSLIRIGDVLYIRGNKAFRKRIGIPGTLPAGTWLKGSATTGPLAPLDTLANLPLTLAGVFSKYGTLTNQGETTFDDQDVVEIDGSRAGKFYLRATGRPYPVAIAGNSDLTGSITFSDFNKSVPLTAPKHAVDISKLGG